MKKITALLAALAIFCAANCALATAKIVRYGPLPEEVLTTFPAGEPTVVLVHGGSWRHQPLVTELKSTAEGLQKNGFTVVDVDYPQAKEEGQTVFPLEPTAVERATEWALGHSQHIVMLGESAGAHLAALTAEALYPRVAGVVALSGPMNLWTLLSTGPHPGVHRALNCENTACSKSYALEWSPVSHVVCIPFLMGYYEKDSIPVSQGRAMKAALPCESKLVVVPGEGHIPAPSKVGAVAFIERVG
jgi:acetyl esterase/lipase